MDKVYLLGCLFICLCFIERMPELWSCVCVGGGGLVVVGVCVVLCVFECVCEQLLELNYQLLWFSHLDLSDQVNIECFFTFSP